jgi:formamidopyrimidine-DNA glycosylase
LAGASARGSPPVPELPEVETIALDLERDVAGANIVRTVVYRPDVLRDVAGRAFVRSTTGVRFDRFWRRAKYAIADLSSGERLVVSPRFTGAFLIVPAPARASRADYTVLAFELGDGRVLRYRDVRRLGTVALMQPERFDAWMATLGPEPFDTALTPSRFAGVVRASRSPIKTILMDQRRIAGIGNIYANEALWRARVDPRRPGCELSAAEAVRLLRESQRVLREALAQRGTSFRDYQDPGGGRGGFLDLAKVYDRAGEPCARCGGRIRSSHEIGGRNTFWCARCQR